MLYLVHSYNQKQNVMKKIIQISSFLIFILLFDSCQQEENLQFISAEQILDGKDYVVNNGMLILKDNTALTKLANEVNSKNKEELDLWEKSISFKSLRSAYNHVIKKEEEILDKLEKQNPEAFLTRKEIGFREESRKFIDKSLFYIDDEEIINMNITDDFFGALVNEGGLLRIGNNVILPQRDFIKMIPASSKSLAPIYLASMENPDPDVKMSEVTRKRNITNHNNAKSQTTENCQNTNDRYRILVDEEYTTNYETGSQCNYQFSSYKVKIRSLKRTVGIWRSHDNYEMRLNGNLKARHMVTCNNSNMLPVQNFLLADQIGYSYVCPYGNTCIKYFWLNYDLGACNINVCTLYSQSVIDFDARSHNAIGFNYTSCYVGN